MKAIDFWWTIFALYASLPSIRAQLVASLPQCVQNCINEDDVNCAITDVTCLCRASTGNFLPNVISCMKSKCDNNLDNNLFLTPTQLACELIGAPIPAAAISNAENEASSIAAQAPTTATVFVGETGVSTTTILGSYTTAMVYGSTVTWGGPETSSLYSSASISTVTVTSISSGTTIFQVYPITRYSTTTETGAISTITQISTTRASGSVSTYTTTASGSIVTMTTTYTQLASSSSRSSASDQSTTSTIFVPEKTQSPSSTGTTTAEPDSATNSSPFTNTNSSARREGVGNWPGLTVLLAGFVAWVI